MRNKNYNLDLVFNEPNIFDIMDSPLGMWVWVQKGDKIYGGSVREGEDDLYIRDNGESVGLTDSHVIIVPGISRYPKNWTDD